MLKLPDMLLSPVSKKAAHGSENGGSLSGGAARDGTGAGRARRGYPA
jgi:hypothetical protein